MEQRRITGGLAAQFRQHLRRLGRSPGTVESYLRSLGQFDAWLKGRPAAPGEGAAWREALLGRGYAPATVNAKLTALNTFFPFAGWGECRTGGLRLQRQLVRGEERELGRQEYARLLHAAQQAGHQRLLLVMEAICSTGIRVSEIQYLTVEAARLGRAQVALKGKIRTILLPAKLCRKLLGYARSQGTASGQVFLTGRGRPLGRKQVWAEMKGLCQRAGVAPSKVFPHNLRHLFARCYYQECRDLASLADVLGHSSVETTRIYLATTALAHGRRLERLHLLL